MPKRKKPTASKKVAKYAFHNDFNVPTTKERKDAMGGFPYESRARKTRETMLLKSAEATGQPSLNAKAAMKEDQDAANNMALSDLDEPKLFIPTRGSQTSFAIPEPKDELDWLAQVPEEGQTFDDYLRLLTTRTSGRMKLLANAEGIEILLLPIVRTQKRPSLAHQHISWPDNAPSMHNLVEYCKVFFDRPVTTLPAAQLYVPLIEGSGDNNKPGAFANASKTKFKLYLPQNDKITTSVNITGRAVADLSSNRIQLQVESLLNELASYRDNRHYVNKGSSQSRNGKNFCIMGITMEDLYDGPTDLFCAGMAFGGNKVAVFSFMRYHPLLKMHPLHWHDYGYGAECDGHSYYDDDDQNPSGLSPLPPTTDNNNDDHDSNTNSDKIRIEFMRRSSKLLAHELGHLYAIDHCIHNRCLMMGTGHLVEDFRAPSHLCGICLRKLQWRTGFDVKMRYKLLADAFHNMGMDNESKWTEKQYKYLTSST